MKKLIALFLLIACAANAQLTIVTYTLTVTNQPTNGETFTVQGVTGTFTNAVVNPLTQILSTNNVSLVASNVLTWLGSIGNIQATFQQTATNIIVIRGSSVTASFLTNWATLTSSTQTTGSGQAIILPITDMPASVRTNLESLQVTAENVYSTNSLDQTKTVASQLVGITNTQTITGQKTFANQNNIFQGGFQNVNLFVTNYPGGEIVILSSISNENDLNLSQLDNSSGYSAVRFTTYHAGTGAYSEFAADGIGTTNAPLYTTAPFGVGFHFMETEGYGIGWVSQGLPLVYMDTNDAQFHIATNGGMADVLYMNRQNGNGGIFGTWAANTFSAVTVASTNVNFTNLAGQTASVSNLAVTGTNTINAALVANEWQNSAIANGVNQDVATGTNVFIQLTGASAAFTTAGYAGGVDGRLLFVESGISQQWTLNNESGLDSTPANRIRTGTGADLVLTNFAFVLMRYDGGAARWKVIFASGNPSSGGSGTFSGSFTGNGGGLTNVTANTFTNYRAGGISFGNLATSVAVTFTTPMATTVGTNYSVAFGFDSTLGAAVTPGATSKTTNGFTATLSAGVAGGTFIDYSAVPYQ